MNKIKVYLETSVISYLTARPSREIIKLAKQELTRQWWEKNRSVFDLYVSDPVIAVGGAPAAYARHYFEMGQKRIAAEKRFQKGKKTGKVRVES